MATHLPEERLRKLEALRAAGVDPYPKRFPARGETRNWIGPLRESYVDGDLVVVDYTRSAFVVRLLHPQIGLKDAVANNFPYSRNCAAERYEEIPIDRVHQEVKAP